MRPPSTPEVASETGALISSGSFASWELVKPSAGGVLSTSTVRCWQVRLPAKSIAQIDSALRPSWKGGAPVLADVDDVESAVGHGSKVFAERDPGMSAQLVFRVKNPVRSTVATIWRSPEPASLPLVPRSCVPLLQPPASRAPPVVSTGSE